MVLQSLFLASSNLARSADSGLILMYLVTIGPVVLGLGLLSASSEKLRTRVVSLFRRRPSEKEGAMA